MVRLRYLSCVRCWKLKPWFAFPPFSRTCNDCHNKEAGDGTQ